MSWQKIIGLAMIMLTVRAVTAQPAQDTIATPYVKYPFVVDSINQIQNAEALAAFYENLSELKHNNDRKLSIVHLGDSHIQGDFMTTIVRRRLQRAFGNAGRGLVVPYRVAGTNEPFTFQSSSTVTWKSKRCVFPDQPLPIGAGGITVSTDDPESRLYLYINDVTDYSFDYVNILHLNDAHAFNLTLREPTIYEPLSASLDQGTTFTTMRLAQPQNILVLDTKKETDSQDHFTLFGLDLRNGKNGIIYHAIGVNGAKCRHYNKATYFESGIAGLQPVLIVVSLGTNESIEYPNINRSFTIELDSLVSGLLRSNPNATIMLTTPQQNLQQEKNNPGVRMIRGQILQYAAENGFAFWDWFAISGAEKGTSEWRKTGLMRSDGVHLSIEGYELQGHLFYHALMKGFQDYVSSRHR